MTEGYRKLYRVLIDTDLGCVPPGYHDTADVYRIVKSEYPDLCNDDILCKHVCGGSNNQPEWKHRVRTVQQDLKRNPSSRVTRLNGDWFYHPSEVDVEPIPENSQFKVGNRYNRWELHDIFGGQRYSGISTPAEEPFVFLFTGDSGEEYGYEDEFLSDDTFVYTGKGTKGDMTLEGENKAIRHHQENNKKLHLFEDTAYPWTVTYVGEFEYEDHYWESLPDKEGNRRDAVRFHLQPVGGTDVEIENGSPSNLSLRELFTKGKESSPTRTDLSNTRSSVRSGQSYKRSEVVKEFARKHADGVCQGCGEDAPFLNKKGRPFLEVHHLYRRSDGGADDPENVIAVCPNCHRRAHYGQENTEFNNRLIEKAEDRNENINTEFR